LSFFQPSEYVPHHYADASDDDMGVDIEAVTKAFIGEASTSAAGATAGRLKRKYEQAADDMAANKRVAKTPQPAKPVKPALRPRPATDIKAKGKVCFSPEGACTLVLKGVRFA
jgi:hypothetical protein